MKLPVLEPVWNLDPRSKYDAPVREVDCAARLHLCKGACCTLEVVLQKADVDEGILAWDPRRPYLLGSQPDGRCAHLTDAGGCAVFAARPRGCRLYSCESDGRIWKDFAARVPNQEVIELLFEAAARAHGEADAPT